jgi:hypothetical protein
MMLVQKYLIEFGIEKLKEEHKIEVRDYPDMVVLNYNQIESDKHNPIVQECRALILRKGSWEVLARSFDKFQNAGEDKNTADFPVSKARIEEKVDGSILSLWYDYDNNKWNVSTRSMAYAEGSTSIGLTFRDIFNKAAEKTNLWKVLDGRLNLPYYITWVFELTSPVTRIVTPYPTESLTLIGARDNFTEKEFSGAYLDRMAELMNVRRPKSFQFTNLAEVQKFIETLPAMEEGFVMTYEGKDKFWRIKVKSAKYLSIANLRNNGSLTPYRILYLVMKGEQTEYLSYFETDKPYFDFVDKEWQASLARIQAIFDEAKNLPTQKEYAQFIMPKCVYDYEKGMLFEMKKGKNLIDIIKDTDLNGAKRLSKSINLKSKMIVEFKINIEND